MRLPRRLGDRGGAGRRRSGPTEERSRPVGGPEQGERVRMRANDVYQSACGALSDRMTAETPRVRPDIIVCDLQMCMFRYHRAELVLTLFRSTSSKMPLDRKIRTTGIKGSATSVVASSFEPNLVCCCFASVSGLDRLFIRQLRPQSDI
jgi:hypothetical protein